MIDTSKKSLYAIVQEEYLIIHNDFFNDLPIITIGTHNFNNGDMYGGTLDAWGLYTKNPFTQQNEIHISADIELFGDIQELHNTIAHELIHQSNEIKGIDDSKHGVEFKNEAIKRGVYNYDFDLIEDMYPDYSECIGI